MSAIGDTRTREIGELLVAQITQITDALYEVLMARIEELHGDQQILDLLYASARANMENLAHLLQGHVPLDHVEVPTTANEYAARLAQRGIPLNALLRAYRLGQRRFLEWAFEQLDRIESDPAVNAAAARSITVITFEYVDRVAEGVVEAYQAERERWLASRSTVRAEILESLLADNRVDVASAEAGLGHRLRQHHLGLVLWQAETAASSQDLRDLETLAGTIGQRLGSSSSPLFIPRDRGTGWAWIPLGRSSTAVEIPGLTEAVAAAGPDIRVAMGMPSAAVAGFRTTHLEALKAQQVALAGRERALPVTWYGDPGVRAASLLAVDPDNARRLVATTLGALALDTENAERLRGTLLTFLQSNDSYVATAAKVHLHKNTVKYRVDKAVEARGKPLDEDRLDLELALIASQWLAPEVLQAESRAPR